MANFQDAYTKYIIPFEGAYVNIQQDKGGETYKGIARNKFPMWDGWVYIDFEKRTKYKNSEIPRGTEFPDIQYLVDKFYHERWDLYKLSEIKNQNLAALLFDYIIHSGATHPILVIQNIVGTTPDGIIGPKTIAAINKANAATVFSRLLKEREKFLAGLIANDPTQKIFENGWKNRLEKFKKLLPLNIAGGSIVAIVIISLLAFT